MQRLCAFHFSPYLFIFPTGLTHLPGVFVVHRQQVFLRGDPLDVVRPLGQYPQFYLVIQLLFVFVAETAVNEEFRPLFQVVREFFLQPPGIFRQTVRDLVLVEPFHRLGDFLPHVRHGLFPQLSAHLTADIDHLMYGIHYLYIRIILQDRFVRQFPVITETVITENLQRFLVLPDIL